MYFMCIMYFKSLVRRWVEECSKIYIKYFNCRPSDSTVSEDAEIEPWTAVTLALTDTNS